MTISIVTGKCLDWAYSVSALIGFLLIAPNISLLIVAPAALWEATGPPLWVTIGDWPFAMWDGTIA